MSRHAGLRRLAAIGPFALALAALGPGSSTHRAVPAAPTEFTMQSMPDFLNSDTADVSTTQFWRPGDPNSINASYRAGLNTVLDDVKRNSGGATSMLIPGDTVEGRWGRDDAGTGIFGPVDTEAHRRAAVVRASDRYYPRYVSRFTTRGYTVHAALGDHEIGDNPWGDSSVYTQFKRRNIYLFKNQWAKYFTGNGTRYANHPIGTNHDKTAYAVRVDPHVLVVTVDMFSRTQTGIVSRLGGGELAWLEATLLNARADGIRWIVVQGHDPVLGPVRYRHSSRMMYEGGQGSAFWKVMAKYGVNVYLCGEVHDTTAIVPTDGGPVQISHGGLFYRGQVGYLNAHFKGDTLTMTYRDFPGASSSAARGYLWQTDRDSLIPADVTYPASSQETGTIVVKSDHTVMSRTGVMTPYEPLAG